MVLLNFYGCLLSQASCWAQLCLPGYGCIFFLKRWGPKKTSRLLKVMAVATNTVSILYFHCMLYYFSVEECDENRRPQPDERSALKRLYSSSLIFLMWSANAIRPSANLRPNLRRLAKKLNTIPMISKKTVTRSTKKGIKNSAAPNNIPASTGLIIPCFMIICF